MNTFRTFLKLSLVLPFYPRTKRAAHTDEAGVREAEDVVDVVVEDVDVDADLDRGRGRGERGREARPGSAPECRKRGG